MEAGRRSRYRTSCTSDFVPVLETCYDGLHGGFIFPMKGKKFFIVTCFLSCLIRTFAWIPLLHETGRPIQPSPPRTINFVPVNISPKRCIVLAALTMMLGFVQFCTPAVADAVLSSPSTFMLDQLDASPSANRQPLYHWSFVNGDVTLSDEIFVAGLRLHHPRLLGSGAGGAVFALQQNSIFPSTSEEGFTQMTEVALKVSWKGSSRDVKNECDILKKLQRSSSTHDVSILAVEVCLGEGPYKLDPSRTMIALQPVFIGEQAASVTDLLPDQHKVETAVAQIVQTMLRMVSANIVTVDVQPLISSETGDVLFIDFTQAISINAENDESVTTDKGVVVVQNFVNEMMLLIPKEQQESIASKIILDELSSYPKQSPYVYDVLMEQNFSNEALEYISRQSML